MNNVRKLIFGRPGSGKTTLGVKEMVESLNDGYFVYSNIKIKWYGVYSLIGGFGKIGNKIYNIIKLITKSDRDEKLNKLYRKLKKYTDIKDNVVYDGNGIPKIDLTKVYVMLYNINKDIDSIETINDNIKNGYFRNYFYHRNRYTYCEDLEDATKQIINKALNPEHFDDKFLLMLDEGFVDLNFGKKVPDYVTNLFNQSRKLNLDITVISQRPVAVYPSYRALCDYMIHIKKFYFGRFEALKYYVDYNANALPDLSTDKEGNEVGERYCTFKGSKIFPYFDTRQSIGLNKLKNEIYDE